MMKADSEFGKALSRMVYENAAKQAIRHLYDMGYDPERIEQNLTYPQSISVIEAEIAKYEAEKARAEETGEKYEYVQTRDRYGRLSYIKKKVD